MPRVVGGHRKVTVTGRAGQVGNSLCGALVGFLLVLGTGWLLWWNEGRAVQTIQSLDEGLHQVTSVSVHSIDASLDAKLVHVQGEFTTLPVLQDGLFGVSAPGIRLERRVEMFQYKEHSRTHTHKENGKEIKETEYWYTEEWSDEEIWSSSFDDPSYRNPRFPVKSESFTEPIQFGAWSLGKDVTSQITHSEVVPLSHMSTHDTPRGYWVVGNFLYSTPNQGAPSIGDVRVSFHVIVERELTIVGQQRGNMIGPYQTKAGDKILLVYGGLLTPKQAFDRALSSNTATTWIVRGVGWFGMFIGFAFCFQPVVVVLGIIPLVGGLMSTIAGLGLCVAAMVLSAVVSLVIIALSWFVHRPLLTGALLAGALFLIITSSRGGKAKQDKHAAAAAAAAEAATAPPAGGAAGTQFQDGKMKST